MKSYYEQLNLIKQDIGRITYKITKTLADQALYDLKRSHELIIDNFYAGHEPSSYRRHGIGGLYHSLVSGDVVSSGSKKNASITVGSISMEDHYNTSSDVVFDLMWNHGVRGLPRQGNKALDKSYTFPPYSSNPIHFIAGEKWVNPYWSGADGPYHNIFLTQIRIGKYSTVTGVPNIVMQDVVEHWDKVNGRRLCNQLVNSIK